MMRSSSGCPLPCVVLVHERAQARRGWERAGRSRRDGVHAGTRSAAGREQTRTGTVRRPQELEGTRIEGRQRVLAGMRTQTEGTPQDRATS